MKLQHTPIGIEEIDRPIENVMKRATVALRERFPGWSGQLPPLGSKAAPVLYDAFLEWAAANCTPEENEAFVQHYLASIYEQAWDQSFDEALEGMIAGKRTKEVAYIGFEGEQLGHRCLVLRKFARPEQLAAGERLVEATKRLRGEGNG